MSLIFKFFLFTKEHPREVFNKALERPTTFTSVLQVQEDILFYFPCFTVSLLQTNIILLIFSVVVLFVQAMEDRHVLNLLEKSFLQFHSS